MDPELFISKAVKVMSAITLSATAAGCASLPEVAPSPTIQQTPLVYRLPGSTQSAETTAPELVTDRSYLAFYPKLAAYRLNEKGIADTPDSTTTLYNFTDIRLNFDTVVASLSYFESLAKAGGKLPYTVDGHEFTFTISPRPISTRTLLFVPQDAPRPKWKGTPSTVDASTTAMFPGRYVIFFALYGNQDKLPPSSFLTTASEFNDKMLAVEACQSSMLIETNTGNNALDTLAQEVTCNSFGLGYAAHQIGFTYDRYLTIARGVHIGPGGENAPSYPLIILDADSYNRLPSPGPLQ